MTELTFSELARFEGPGGIVVFSRATLKPEEGEPGGVVYRASASGPAFWEGGLFRVSASEEFARKAYEDWAELARAEN